jgi:hypothetical protein
VTGSWPKTNILGQTELCSPRVRKTTAEALAMLTRSDSFRFTSEISGPLFKEKVQVGLFIKKYPLHLLEGLVHDEDSS